MSEPFFDRELKDGTLVRWRGGKTGIVKEVIYMRDDQKAAAVKLYGRIYLCEVEWHEAHHTDQSPKNMLPSHWRMFKDGLR